MQRIPSAAYATPTERVSPSVACLLAVYTGRNGSETSDSAEAVLTIAPPPASRMRAIACLQPQKTPRTLTLKSQSNSSFEVSSSGFLDLNAGVVDHEVEAAPLADAAVERRDHLLLDGDVAGLVDGVAADLLGDRLGTVAVDVGNHHARPFLGEQLRDLPAQA